MAYFTSRLAKYSDAEILELENRVAEHEAARSSKKYSMPKEKPKFNWVGQVVKTNIFGIITDVIEEINIFNLTEKDAKEEIRLYVKAQHKGKGYSDNLKKLR